MTFQLWMKCATRFGFHFVSTCRQVYTNFQVDIETNESKEEGRDQESVQ